MSTETDVNPMGSAHPRRFACDRCHRHKLKCERNPIVSDGSIVIPLSPCKRCTKAQADCRTTTSYDNNPPPPTSSKGGAGVGSGTVKRKTPPSPEDDMDHVSTASRPSSSSMPPPESNAEGSIFGGFHVSSQGSMMYHDGTPFLLDFDNFDFEADAYTGAAEGVSNTVTPTSLDLAVLTGGTLHELAGNDDHDPETAGVPYDDKSLAHTPNMDGAAAKPSPPGSPDDMRRRALELHSFVFTQLHRVTDVDLAEAIFSSPNPSLSSSDAAAGPGANIIHRLLHASDLLLELLTLLRLTWHNNNAGSKHDSPTAPPSTTTTTSHHYQQHQQPRFLNRTRSLPWSLLSQHLQPRAEDIFLTQDPNNPPEHRHPSPPPASTIVDLPTIATFLTCHVSILSVYRTIFTRIYDALRACEQPPLSTSSKPNLRPRALSSLSSSSSSSSSTRPSIFLAMQMDNNSRPSLSSKHVLGLRIQLEVMTHMLDRMDGAWTAALADSQQPHRDDEHEHDQRLRRKQDYRCLFGSETTLVLLQSMLAHEGYDVSVDGDSAGTGLGALTDMVKRIRQLLRSCGST